MKTSGSPPTKTRTVRKLALLAGAPNEHLEALQRNEQELKHASDYVQTIVQTVPPLLVLDADLRVKTANQTFCEHFRVSPLDTENQLLYELGDGAWNVPQLRILLEKVLSGQTPFKDYEVSHKFETIGRRTLLLSGRQLARLPMILLSIVDITEQAESRAVMRASEIRYRRLFEAARDGILILNPDTRKITDANPFMSEILDYRHSELLGKELWEIGLLKDEAANRMAFEQLQERAYIRYENLPLQNKKGERHEVEFVSNVYDEDGRKVIQCNIRDITERKRMQDALCDANDRLTNQAAKLEEVVAERTRQLRETIGELEAFSYSVAHDMRAPLRAMQGFAQFLMDEYSSKLDEQGVNYLERIMHSSVRLDRLIRDVLSYTKILHLKPPKERVDLDRLLREILQTFGGEPFVQGRTVRPELEIHGTLPKVEANEALLGQCIFNLLSNGVKFVSPGTTPHLEVSAETVEDDSIRVRFKDNGIGIAPEDHHRIFGLFERIHPASEYEGTGIGLAIVRKAAERMGAQIGFESALGKGSSFWIQLKKGER